MRCGVFRGSGQELLGTTDPRSVGPEVCLASGAVDAGLTFDEVARVNRDAVQSASRYWFAHGISRCPIRWASAL